MPKQTTHMPLDWHRRNVANKQSNVEYLKKRLDALAAEWASAERDLEIYKRQISEAERLGKDSFTAASFVVSRRAGKP